MRGDAEVTQVERGRRTVRAGGARGRRARRVSFCKHDAGRRACRSAVWSDEVVGYWHGDFEAQQGARAGELRVRLEVRLVRGCRNGA